jgi:hypothetical protein
VSTARVLPYGRVKGTWGRGLEMKNGERGGGFSHLDQNASAS